MGRITASVKIENPSDAKARIRCDALVDTGSSFMALPSAWRDRLGKLDDIGKIELETATQESVEGEICAPVRIQIEGFRAVYIKRGHFAGGDLTPPLIKISQSGCSPPLETP